MAGNAKYTYTLDLPLFESVICKLSCFFFCSFQAVYYTESKLKMLPVINWLRKQIAGE